ncbi:hypothetical protein DPMN_144101 [Dreissena polymorpha]|uniref:Uncharacterized protein n=1 Tax=Dreissena polymorpha TaxID=45954 RepID=A0A9D4GEZ0_DREPO|nr:hypothetical protein DPMN_144101 [Dreissena polymorpha]
MSVESTPHLNDTRPISTLERSFLLYPRGVILEECRDVQITLTTELRAGRRILRAFISRSEFVSFIFFVIQDADVNITIEAHTVDWLFSRPLWMQSPAWYMLCVWRGQPLPADVPYHKRLASERPGQEVVTSLSRPHPRAILLRGATAAANMGISDRFFKSYGRWSRKSAEYGYVEDYVENRIRLS